MSNFHAGSLWGLALAIPIPLMKPTATGLWEGDFLDGRGPIDLIWPWIVH